jgi:hypothetical protein
MCSHVCPSSPPGSLDLLVLKTLSLSPHARVEVSHCVPQDWSPSQSAQR